MTPALRSRSTSPADDVARLGRRVRSLAADGTGQIARRADVPHLVEVGREGAASAVRDAVDRVAGGQRRRRRSFPMPILLIVPLVALVALAFGVWWFVRGSAALAALRAIDSEDEDGDLEPGAPVDQELDAEMLARGTDEGFGAAWATPDLPEVPVPPEGGPAESADRTVQA